jgi:hypothetical protein
MLAKD